MANSRYEYVKSFEAHDALLPSTWIVIRIDGCHFHSFVLKKSSKFYERRSRKSCIDGEVWQFKSHSPLPETHGSVNLSRVMQDVENGHINNQYNTCFWMLVDSGKSKREAQDILKGTQTSEKNELLYEKFGINYNMIPAIFRKGSCIYREMVDEIVKYNEAGTPIRRPRKKVVLDHCDIIGPEFWNEHPTILLDK
ncbi:tRNA(His) guanylyltransferase 1-like isoform X5 [Nymphaea colorata]|uniref:tRNA(His) guanylyltransferase 1-like isoform X5 n=1 Tax=Nymphaea colorata TaxID=210225 RepID=UPI00214EA739|nr:tRNA(His) guanylyltransferase 1-like isoform X5 [Nymphaea colorata]